MRWTLNSVLVGWAINWACQPDCARQQVVGNRPLKEAGAMTISRRTFFLMVEIVLLAVVIVVLWWLVRPQKTDRQQIVDLLAHTERAIEQRDLGGLMQAVSEDYDDGTYSKRELRRAELDVDVWIDSDQPHPTIHTAMWVKLSKESSRWLVTSAGGDWPDVPARSFPYQ